MTSKKNRGKNFVDEEVTYLIKLVGKFKTVIENKKTNYLTNEQKATTWKIIEAEYNSMFPSYPRSAAKLMTKYDNLKQYAKKYAIKRRHEQVTMGEWPYGVKENYFYEQILEIMKQTSVEGEKSDHDYLNSQVYLQDDSRSCSIYEGNSHDKILLDEETPRLTAADEIKREISPEAQQTCAGEESDTFAESAHLSSNVSNRSKILSDSENPVDKIIRIKEKYYNLKIKYLEADIALKKQELKERQEQDSLKLELLKLQVEEQRLLIVEKKRKLDLE